ncbi:L-2-hydroxyglutarate oxidase [Lichenihabitans sp. PAMC28606]|uniref:L-2-hydroxyglutarate oxidase n=1 Tax=Lichenihabitans sp. PAMC28606 TaxID=2880932 RepID=UPI001D09F68F|nr:L-2-hydroxyglutarate oxidase [Lichenihabitans sp. PAMC28606]UDL93932.1 L-2-hydroxyglutarate oxidase [Lichenihabitans sp. PAMC28606]
MRERSAMRFDFCIIGGGIVGLATARELLLRHPGASLVLLEKEAGVARHQTGHNSGVIHSGIYYAPGSLKARLCREGADATQLFCRENGVPVEPCGKLIVATTMLELERMETLRKRAAENDIAVTQLSATGLRETEPAIVGLGALKVHATGIVDYRLVCRRMADELVARGADLRFGERVTGIAEEETVVRITTANDLIEAGHLVVCAGLQSDRLARLAGLDIDFQIIPFRGEYFVLPPEKSTLVRHLIYPVPDPTLPFLGIHLTRMADGTITVGPNAVLGFSREGYAPLSVDLRDCAEMFAFPGLWRTLRQNLSSGLREFRNSLWRRGYLAECRKYCPGLDISDLRPYPAGIRAQAVRRSGELIHDFLFLQSARSLHVCNAPSPAATSAIPIARMIAARLFEEATPAHAIPA